MNDTTTETENYVGESFSCKVILNSEEMPRSSKQWTRAKKSTLTFKETGLAYGNLFTPYAEIEKATLHIYKSAFFFEYGILSLETTAGKHHFGIKYSDFWKQDLPFKVEHREEETPYILFRRMLMLCIVVYLFWEILKQ